MSGAAGCSDPADPEPGGTTGENGLTGTAVDTYLHEGQELTRPRSDITAVAALVPGDDGAFASFPGTIAADGSFAIPGVPAGEVYLAFTYEGGRTNFIATSARSVDLGRLLTGRPEAAPVTTSPTPVIVNADGLDPWQDNDSMEIYAPGAGAWGTLVFLENPPLPGDVSLAGMTFDSFELIFPFLIEGDKGDTAFITQLVTTTTENTISRSLRKVLKPAPFTQADGQATTITGTFEDVPPEPHSIDWKLSQYDALAGDVHAQAEITDHYISVYTEPAAPTRTISAVGSLLADASTTATADMTLDLAYGNPFPEWGAYIGGNASYRFSVTPPGFPQPRSITGSAGSWVVKDTWTSVAMAPLVGPPEDVQVNGMPTTDALAGVGDSPTVSWSAPDLGTPGYYRITVRELMPDTPSQSVTTLYTEGTQIRIPPGVLQAGKVYYLRVASTTGNELTKPYLSGPEGGYAEALTNVLSL